MKSLFLAVLALVLSTEFASAQSGAVQMALQEQRELIEKSSRRTIGPAIEALAESGLPQMQNVLETWQAKARDFKEIIYPSHRNGNGPRVESHRTEDEGAPEPT